MIKRVKIFVERVLREAQSSNDLEYIRSRLFAAYGAVSFVIDETHDENLVTWWDNEMRTKFYTLMIER